MWDELQAAAEVVRRGTVSAAAENLGVHRATINRRIDTLEAYLGGKLFQRHKRGYTPTELGADLLLLAKDAGDRLERLRRRAASQDRALRGDLIVTSIDGLAPIILGKISEFTARFPGINISFRAANSPLRLELGEAHVAFRIGSRPEELDYVVLPHEPLRLGLYASEAYIHRCGKPDAEDLSSHRFVLPRLSPGEDPPDRWLEELIENPDLVLTANTASVVDSAVRAGVGVGFVPVQNAAEDPSLIEIVPSKPAWQVPSWIVTHVDLHRSPKVQAFITHCRREPHS
ncbi:MAG: LysR family transcriptional regulator [Paracoccaceae bacterium]